MTEKTHNKIDFAVAQLEMALNLFLSGKSYVSALMFSGAAEEILGMALTIDEIENYLQWEYKSYSQPDYNYMVVAYSNGTREVYWNDGLKSGTDKGTHRIEGDQICVTWQNSFEGKEQCFEVFKIGESKYESWSNGKLAFTYFKIR